MKQEQYSSRPTLTAFSYYLHTGRRLGPVPVEVKFNPWHDEQDGRFTFVGQGRYFGADGGRGGSYGGGGATGSWKPPLGASPRGDAVPDRRHLRPDHPNNYSLYVVRQGDSLSRIARQRTGLTARDLAWLNQQTLDQPLHVGQRVKLPHQAYLDAGRAARNKMRALSHYMDTHGGKLPPDPSNPPSLESQVLDSHWKKDRKNGYDFHIDAIERSRQIIAELTDGPVAKRSRRAQAEAGQPNRRPSDDGGHFIAARFNGPSDSANHFAQDKNFNRGAHRSLEVGWAKALQSGHKVVVDIVPAYHGTSRRPYEIAVTWYVDGKRQVRKFANEAKGDADDAR